MTLDDRRRALPVRLALGALVLAVAGCGPSPSVSASGPTPTVELPTTLVPPATSGASPAGTVAVDRTLLTVLPSSVDGVPVQESPEGEADAMAASALPPLASAIVAAVAVDTASSDLVYALVVRLRSGALTDGSFREWRDSYDEGACGSPSAVVGNAQASIGGRTVYVGTCASGLHTYHVWIADHGLLISASSVGTRRLGERLLTDLRP